MGASSVFSETSLEVDVSRRGAGRSCLMFVVLTSYVEDIAMVKTGNECQLSAYMLFLG